MTLCWAMQGMTNYEDSDTLLTRKQNLSAYENDNNRIYREVSNYRPNIVFRWPLKFKFSMFLKLQVIENKYNNFL
jgi:hypothetical protein